MLALGSASTMPDFLLKVRVDSCANNRGYFAGLCQCLVGVFRYGGGLPFAPYVRRRWRGEQLTVVFA